MSSVIKGNRPLRIFAGVVLVVLIVSHFMGQVDLTELSFLWLLIAMSINAFQASFTGFCPMFKNENGECVACGVACDSTSKKNESSSCCSSTEPDCCSDKNSKEACCSESESDCCAGENSKESCCSEPLTSSDTKGANKSGCCDQSAGCCESTEGTDKVVKVLGTGCKSCATTFQLIAQVAVEKGVNVELLKVEDVADIATYGVMSTPAVVIGDEVVHSGSIPSKQMVETWLDK